MRPRLRVHIIRIASLAVPGLRAAILEVCRDSGFTPRVTQEATQAFTVVGLVGSGLGVALMPRVITRFTNDQVCSVALVNRNATGCLTLAVATRDRDVPEATRRLCEAIVQRRGGRNSKCPSPPRPHPRVRPQACRYAPPGRRA